MNQSNVMVMKPQSVLPVCEQFIVCLCAMNNSVDIVLLIGNTIRSMALFLPQFYRYLLALMTKWKKLVSGCFLALQSAFPRAKQRVILNKSPLSVCS